MMTARAPRGLKHKETTRRGNHSNEKYLIYLRNYRQCSSVPTTLASQHSCLHNRGVPAAIDIMQYMQKNKVKVPHVPPHLGQGLYDY
jgi:hypothetical protein